MKFLIFKIVTFCLIILNYRVDGSEFRILNFDRCKGHEKYMIVEQCEANGNTVNARARFISVIDSIIVCPIDSIH